ncbi:FAD-binding oxidoreductase [Nitratireductor sp. XY-223]|uniref:NAD(P)/FAD-dependent oxidoreductase n=1 Tax=Nitratireductor sp. XY-223 TaxID=2561926 RepID=UPI0010AB3D80|nr:FAD-binding oxidoreductase [Nitratireductor sp. XY-223]
MAANTSSLWQATGSDNSEYPVLDSEKSVDLVIVGGGFTGCSAALTAAGQGMSVCLLEAEKIGHGGSGRNVGLVNAGLWTPPDEVERILGPQQGNRLNAALAAAPDLVFSLIEEHAIDCEAVRNGTLHCAHSDAGLRDLRRRFEQQKRRDAPVTLLDALDTAARTGTSRYHGALHDARAGTIQPLSYCRGLARAAFRAGAELYCDSPVVRIERRKDRWLVQTRSGTVSANALLVAANAYARPAAGVPDAAYVPVHYFQLASRPMDDHSAAAILPGGEGCWDTATVMSSFRKDRQGRLIVGAVGSLGHAGASVHRRWARSHMVSLFPHLADLPIEFAWHGRIAMTSDHLPKIVRFGPNAFSVFGFSGRGIGPGTVFGKSLASALASGNEEALPVTPMDSYREPATGLKAAYYEAGACIVHLLRP